MPQATPDRDDRQGNMAGQGGPQDGPIGQASDRNQQPDNSEPAEGDFGEGGQRHEDGSSRDTEGRH